MEILFCKKIFVKKIIFPTLNGIVSTYLKMGQMATFTFGIVAFSSEKAKQKSREFARKRNDVNIKLQTTIN